MSNVFRRFSSSWRRDKVIVAVGLNLVRRRSKVETELSRETHASETMLAIAIVIDADAGRCAGTFVMIGHATIAQHGNT